MKVYEVMAKLAECKANAEVYLKSGDGFVSVEVVDTDSSPDTVFIEPDSDDE